MSELNFLEDNPGNLKTLSIVIPVLNEEEIISSFCTRIESVANNLIQPQNSHSSVHLELIFIDDGSTDGTVDTILSLETRLFNVQLVKLTRNFGKDAALAAGFIAARGHAVIAMDVDLQDPPELIPEMIEAWMNGAMVVNAKRSDRSSDSWSKRWSAEVFYALFDRISNYSIPRNVGDFRLLDRKVVDQLNMIEERIRFNKGIIAWLGYKSAEVTYVRSPREAGSTKWHAWSLWNFAMDGITGSSTLPLRIWSYVGGVLSVLALCYAVFLVVRTLIFGVDQPGYASLMVVTLIIGGANMVAIGILGEYVGRISIEVKRRPLFLVEETYDLPRTDDAHAPSSEASREK